MKWKNKNKNEDNDYDRHVNQPKQENHLISQRIKTKKQPKIMSKF